MKNKNKKSSSLIMKGYRNDLTKNDTWEMDDTEKSKILSEKLENLWTDSFNK
jgi:hypothetical protein